LGGGAHYNYFRDYDPAIGRYVQSDPIGLRGGINTYGYVGAHPLIALDPFGLAELCRRILEQKWEEVGRGWKIIDYRYRRSSDGPLDAFMNAITTIKPGFGFGVMIPILRDLALEQLHELDVQVCIDECTKKETRTVLFDRPLNQYRENWYNPHLGDREGDPVIRDVFDGPPTRETRWGR